MTRSHLPASTWNECGTFPVDSGAAITAKLVDYDLSLDALEAGHAPPLGTLFVDLRSTPYNVTVNDTGGAVANGIAISQALLDYSGTGALLLLPAGRVYVAKNLSGTGAYRFAAVRAVGVTDVTLAGTGDTGTVLTLTGDQAAGLSQILLIADGTQRLTVRNLGFEHGPGVANIDAAGLQNHQVQIDATNTDVTDVVITDCRFGTCIGDAIRNLGGVGVLKNIRVLNVTMRLNHHSQAPNGCRSGISWQRGVDGYELGNFYIWGPKNSPIDFEPTVAGLMAKVNIHDGLVDNSGGKTEGAVSFDGLNATSPLVDSCLRNLVVLQGIVQVINTQRCRVSDVTVYSSGVAGMAGISDPLLEVLQYNEDLLLSSVNLVRDTGSTAGPLVSVVHSGGDPTLSPNRVTIHGGVWLTRVGPGANLRHVDLQDVNHLHWSDTRLRLEDPSPAGSSAAFIRPGNHDVTNVLIEGITLESPGGPFARFVGVSALNHAVTGLIIRGLRTDAAAVTVGVYLDAQGGQILDPQPVIQGCDFGGSPVWAADHTAVGTVFPVVWGNRGGVCGLTGTVDPTALVSAAPGSRYTRENGASTTFWRKTNTGTAGWTTE